MKTCDTISDERVLVTGASGLLGAALVRSLSDSCDVVGTYNTGSIPCTDIETHQIDLRRKASIETLFSRVKPDTVFHCAAITDVDYCERNPKEAVAVNTEAVECLAQSADACDATLVFISTDSVYGGDGSFHTEDDPLNPVNVYSETKVEAERAVRTTHPHPLIIRTAIHGWSPGKKQSLSEWIYETLSNGEPVSLFEDASFSPLYADDLAGLLVAATVQEATGVYNFASPNRLTKLEFGRTMAEVFGLPETLIQSSLQAEFGFEAQRPLDNSLSIEKAKENLDLTFPTVRDGFKRMKTDLEKETSKIQ